MRVTKEISIAMGHTVTNHNSRCRGLHGHEYRIIATAEGSLINQSDASDEGMVIDFSDLKQAMMTEIDELYDHGFVIYKDDPRKDLLEAANELWCYQPKRFHVVDFIPTAENLAWHWALSLEKLLFKRGIKLYSLEVFETPTSSAIYFC